MKPTNHELVPMNECIKGRVYKIKCRNLLIGVFDGKEGFIGIREKFGSRYLFTEYHYEQGAPFGTVYGAVDMGIDLPDDIPPKDDLGTYCTTTGRDMVYCDTDPNPNFPNDYCNETRQGWWRYADTDEPAPAVKAGTSACMKSNKALFAFLKEIETREYPEEWKSADQEDVND